MLERHARFDGHCGSWRTWLTSRVCCRSWLWSFSHDLLLSQLLGFLGTIFTSFLIITIISLDGHQLFAAWSLDWLNLLLHLRLLLLLQLKSLLLNWLLHLLLHRLLLLLILSVSELTLCWLLGRGAMLGGWGCLGGSSSLGNLSGLLLRLLLSHGLHSFNFERHLRLLDL